MQELLHALHALFILDLAERVFHRIDSAIICKVHLSGNIGLVIHIENMTFFRGPVEHDFLLFRR